MSADFIVTVLDTAVMDLAGDAGRPIGERAPKGRMGTLYPGRRRTAPHRSPQSECPVDFD
jgi:hypothetical protein